MECSQKEEQLIDTENQSLWVSQLLADILTS